MNRDGDRILTSRPGLTLRPERPDDEALLFRIFVASKERDFADMPLTQQQKDFLLRQQHVSQLYNWRHQYPKLEQWIVEDDGEPVGRLVFFILPDQILTHDITMLPGRRGVGGGRLVLRDVVFAEGARTGKVVRGSVTPLNPARRIYARLGVVELPMTPKSPMVPLEWRPLALRG